MQYLVNVSGEVSNSQNKTYVVNSSSEEDAQLIAAQSFCNEFSANSNSVRVVPQKRMYTAITAFIFMLIPIFLSLINWKSGHDTISISPDYLSCLYAILFYASFIVRFKGIHRTVGSWVDILFCVFSILLLSTFIKTLFTTKTFNLLGIIKFDVNTNVVLPIALVLSWLGLKIVSLVCIAGISVLALFNITILSDAMGTIFGSLYIICSFIGIMLYLSVEPAFLDAKRQIGHAAVIGLSSLSKDVAYSKLKIANTSSAISSKFKEAKDRKNNNKKNAKNSSNN